MLRKWSTKLSFSLGNKIEFCLVPEVVKYYKYVINEKTLIFILKNENCSSPIKKHSFSIEWTKLHMRNLSHTQYFQRELTHVGCKLVVIDV